MIPYGDITLGDTVDFAFPSAVNGAPTSLVGGTLAAYPASSTTEITAGIVLTPDFDARTGLNHVTIAATGGNGYLTATEYDVVLTAGTVGGVSVAGAVVAHFSIGHRPPALETDLTALIATVGVAGAGLTSVGITSNIKKNQALAKFQFLMTDSTTHAPKPGLTGGGLTCTRSIDGGAFAAGTLANPAEVSNGTYTIDFGAADLNGKVIVLRVVAAASDDTFERITTQP